MATALTDLDLQLQFSTPQPEALLLLAAGQADHLLLQLHSGRLQVSDVSLLASSSSKQPPTGGVILCESHSPWGLYLGLHCATVAPKA